MANSHLRLGEILVEAGVVSPADLDKALILQQDRQLRLGTILLQEDMVDEKQLIQALSKRLSIPWVSLSHIDIDEVLLDLVPVSVAEEFFLLPIYIRTTGTGEQALYVAMNDPTDDAAHRFVSASSGMTVKPMIAGPSDISAAIRFYYYDEDDSMPSIPPPVPPPPRSTGQEVRSTALPPPPPPLATRTAEPSMAPPPPPTMARISEIPKPPEPDNTLQDPSIAPMAGLFAIDEDDDDDAPEITASLPTPEALDDLAPYTTDNDDAISAQGDGQKRQRAIEKHMFGVGGKVRRKPVTMTLLDGTTIVFGAAAKAPPETPVPPSNGPPLPPPLSPSDQLIIALRQLASGNGTEVKLPSTHWADYMAAMLDVLFRKHLIGFDEFMSAIQANKPK